MVKMLDIASLVTQLNAVSGDSLVDDKSRDDLVAAAKALLGRVERPFDRVMQPMVVQPLIAEIIQIGIDTQLFHQFTDTTTTKTTAELAATTGISAILLSRFLRVLSADCMFVEVAKNTFTANPIVLELASPEMVACYPTMHNIYRRSLAVLPDYFRNLHYANPSGDDIDAAFDVAHDVKSYWDWFRAHPADAKGFQAAMVLRAKTTPRWMSIYPVAERMLPEASKDAAKPLLVDVGGGTGPDVAAFHAKYPDVPGRLILQDLPNAIQQAKAAGTLDPAIEPMEHDFFTEQPVRGARVYYLGNVLHDWPDADAVRILARLRDAMEPGYSRILINECVIPDMGASAAVATSDVLMMTMSNAMERTEEMWRELVGSVTGLEVVAIWGDERAYKRVVEVVLARGE